MDNGKKALLVGSLLALNSLLYESCAPVGRLAQRITGGKESSYADRLRSRSGGPGVPDMHWDADSMRNAMKGYLNVDGRNPTDEERLASIYFERDIGNGIRAIVEPYEKRIKETEHGIDTLKSDLEYLKVRGVTPEDGKRGDYFKKKLDDAEDGLEYAIRRRKEVKKGVHDDYEADLENKIKEFERLRSLSEKSGDEERAQRMKGAIESTEKKLEGYRSGALSGVKQAKRRLKGAKSQFRNYERNVMSEDDLGEIIMVLTKDLANYRANLEGAKVLSDKYIDEVRNALAGIEPANEKEERLMKAIEWSMKKYGGVEDKGSGGMKEPGVYVKDGKTFVVVEVAHSASYYGSWGPKYKALTVSEDVLESYIEDVTGDGVDLKLAKTNKKIARKYGDDEKRFEQERMYDLRGGVELLGSKGDNYVIGVYMKNYKGENAVKAVAPVY